MVRALDNSVTHMTLFCVRCEWSKMQEVSVTRRRGILNISLKLNVEPLERDEGYRSVISITIIKSAFSRHKIFAVRVTSVIIRRPLLHSSSLISATELIGYLSEKRATSAASVFIITTQSHSSNLLLASRNPRRIQSRVSPCSSRRVVR